MPQSVTCPKCKYKWQLIGHRPGSPRSTGPGSQNHHAWGHATQIGKEIGEDGRDVLYECCIRAAPDYPTRMDAFGKIVAKRWSMATVEEASCVIERLHQLAADLGIILIETERKEEK
jgi:hypothetical protein